MEINTIDIATLVEEARKQANQNQQTDTPTTLSRQAKQDRWTQDVLTEAADELLIVLVKALANSPYAGEPVTVTELRILRSWHGTVEAVAEARYADSVVTLLCHCTATKKGDQIEWWADQTRNTSKTRRTLGIVRNVSRTEHRNLGHWTRMR